MRRLATVKQELENISAVAIVVSRYNEMFTSSKLVFFHSVNIHPDGEVEDSFGKQPLDNVLNRFGIIEYVLDVEKQKEVDERLKANSPEIYLKAYNLAKSVMSKNNTK